MSNDTTEQRIERILKEFPLSLYDKNLLKLELEALVIQAQLEQLQKETE